MPTHRDTEWLAQKLQGVANNFPFEFNDNPRRQSRADTRTNLGNLAATAQGLLNVVPNPISPETDAISQMLAANGYSTTEFRHAIDQLRQLLPALVRLASDAAEDLHRPTADLPVVPFKANRGAQFPA